MDIRHRGGIVLSGKYDDIIKLPRFVSKKYPQMSMHDRAAQFSPFVALTGYDDLVKETARITDQKVELDEYILDNLNERLCILKKNLSERTEVDITYFQEDLKKSGGRYLEKQGIIKKIDEFKGCVIFEDGVIIPIGNICEIECGLFQEEMFS